MNTPLELEQEKIIVAVTNLKVIFSVFNIAKHKNKFKSRKPSRWEYGETIEKLKQSIGQRKQNKLNYMWRNPTKEFCN